MAMAAATPLGTLLYHPPTSSTLLATGSGDPANAGVTSIASANPANAGVEAPMDTQEEGSGHGLGAG